MTDAAPTGGETRPPTAASAPPEGGPGGRVPARPNLARGLAYGVGMAAIFVLGWVVVAPILELRAGLVLLAATAGWLIGTAVALGAEPGTLRRTRSTILLAVGVCLGTWLVGTWAAYVVGLAILPASTLDLFGRMANAPFLDLVATAFLPGGLLELMAIALFGWLGAR